MKDKTTLTPVLEKLEDLFSKLNSEFYGGKLQAPVITISHEGRVWLVYRLESLDGQSPKAAFRNDAGRSQGR